jgi:hypothetical protein
MGLRARARRAYELWELHTGVYSLDRSEKAAVNCVALAGLLALLYYALYNGLAVGQLLLQYVASGR